MQAGSMSALSPAFNLHPPASGYNSELADNLSGDFGAKLKLEAFGCESGDMEDKEASKMEAALDEKKLVDGGENSEEEEEDEEDEEEFSFACVNPDGSPISADDAFADGQIRPIFPLFNRDLLLADDAYDGDSKPEEGSSSTLRPPLRKFFVEEHGHPPSSSTSESDEQEEGAPAGPFCEWSGKAELSKKSNSTGFSKIWRLRELVRRSNSDGRDAFVFLNHSKPSSEPTTEAKKNEEGVVEKKEKVGKVEVKRVVRSAKTRTTTASSSAHEAHYVKNRAKREGDKRKSYLPYRVGFFTNVNGLSRNVHPF